MRIRVLLGTLVMLMAMIAVPTAMAANTFYLVPQDSTGTIGGSTTVDLMMDVDTTFAGYQLDINFDNSIVDIPASGVTYVWGSGSTTNYGTYTRLVASSDDTVAGTYTLATLTLDGQSTPGTSGLNFSGTMLSDPNGDPLAHTTTNGTYTIPAALEPDLVVTNIDPSQAIFVDATNVFTVHVENQGTANVSGSFNVSWQITDDASVVLASGTGTITGLNTGEEKTFNFEWKPTVLQNTTVLAIADSGSAVAESDETNNTLSITYIQDTGILPLSDWGYGGDEPLTNYKSGEVIGDLIYTFGDSAYLSGYNNPWSTYTVNFDLGSDVNQINNAVEGVGSGTVQDARLYMYYTWYRTPLGWPADPEQKMTMTFGGNPISTVVKYEDACGFGYYADYKYGTFVYDVTSYVTGDGAYQAILTNDATTGGNPDTHGTGIYGMALLVIYEDGSKSLKEYHIAEGHDILKQYYYKSSTGRYGYHVLPEDATSTFNMPEATGGLTNLFTVTHAAASSPDKSRLYFNAEWWSDPWMTVFGSTGTDIVDVTWLNNNPNTVAFQDRGDGYSATNAILISDKSKPDLIVTNIDPSQAIFVDATNVFTVHVENQGTANVSGSFDVSWQITDDVSSILASGTGTITGLNIGEEKTFNFEWKPTVLQNTSVSATADSGAVVAESDETNNDHSVTYVSGTGILPLSDWGYGGDEPLTNYKSGEVIGDLIYTFGDSAYLSGYNNPWSTYTVNFDLGSDVNQINNAVEGVGSGTVQDARLYMYYTWYRTPLGWPADPEQKMTMTFGGNPISTVVKYEDACGFGYYADYKYGTFVYDVTSYVTGNGAYQAILTNDATTGGNPDTHGTGIYGMALLVIYEDGSKSLKEYHIAEGHDILKQYYYKSSTGRYGYHVLPEDATSTVDMPEATGGLTKLFTVTHDAKSSPDMSRLYFNTGQWSDPWTTVFGSTGTDMEDVTLLKDNPNTVAFQDRGDGYSATNAILISFEKILPDSTGVYDNEGTWALWNTTDDAADIVGFGWQNTIPVAGDWDGDGVTEVGIYNIDGSNFLIMTDTGFDVIGLGWEGITPVVGDWNGDGADEVGVYDNEGTWALWNTTSGAADIVGFGWQNTIPVIGDWNGDDVTEVGIYNIDGSNFLIMTDTGFDVIGLGWEGITPVVGDWNGDGAVEVGVYDNEGTWALWNTTSGAADIVGFGWQNTIPVIGDWDSDDVTEVGIYNIDGSNFLIRTDTGFDVIGLGWEGVTPVVGCWS